MVTRRTLEKIQRNLGFTLDFLEKTYHLTRILHKIQQTEILAKNLTLKGGTALNFLYLDLPRLSIDIDFNYTGAIPRNFMKAARPFIDQSIQVVGDHLGYTVKEKDSSYILSRYDLRYTTVRNTKDHVTIEINYLDRLPIGDSNTKKFVSLFPDLPTFSVPTYSLEELTAQKIKACIERTEPRDIYDVSLLAAQLLNTGKTRKYVAVYYCMIEEDKTTNVLQRIEAYDLKKLRQELRQFVRNTEQFDAENIRKNAVEFLTKMVSFTTKEQQFIETFYTKQNIIPELLFKEKPLLIDHPSLLFRLNSLKKKQHRRSQKQLQRK